MSEIVIQKHNFENAKNELKKFSEQTSKDLSLRKVDDSKGVGEFFSDWFFGRGIGLDHTVTGEELNNLTSQIQIHLQSINDTQIKLIKEFKQVYCALDALDQDYITAILTSIEATEETSGSIQETQGQIRKIVENQRKTLEELKLFKQKATEKIQGLSEQSGDWNNTIEYLLASIEKTEKTGESIRETQGQIKKIVEEQKKALEDLKSFRKKLDGYTHLADIDKIWNGCQRQDREIAALSKSIEDIAESSKEGIKKADTVKIALTVAEEKIEDLVKQSGDLVKKLESIIAFTADLERVAHLNDIDEMWELLSSAHKSIHNISGEIDSIQNMSSKSQEDIHILIAFMRKLSELKRLMEVDDLWEKSERHLLRIQKLEQTDESHTSQLTEFKKINEKLAITVQETNVTVESLMKRIKHLYLLAGGAMGLAIIELILLLVKVI